MNRESGHRADAARRATRRALLMAFCGGLVMWRSAGAQQKDKVKVIGLLLLAGKPGVREEVLDKRLRELGWIDGKNVRVEYRLAANRVENLPALAEDLVRLKVDLIVASATPAVAAAKNATHTIPIVSISADPVGNGFVASLARPGGNITGVSLMAPQLTGKQLELLREISPKLSRVAFLAHGSDPSHKLFLSEAEEAGKRLGIRIQRLIVTSPEEIEGAFSNLSKQRSEALVVQPIFVNTLGLSRTIADLALKSRVLNISNGDIFPDAGGLMYFGPDPVATYQLVANYVDRILRDARPGDLPIEQPTKFELVVNLKTAKALGLNIPQPFLMRADRVIE